MRRFFVSLFVISLLATAGTFYWRTYLPEATGVLQIPEAAPRGVTGDDAVARSYREVTTKAPSSRQDLAVTISILSSIISAAAALLQTWLTARAYRR